MGCVQAREIDSDDEHDGPKSQYVYTSATEAIGESTDTNAHPSKVDISAMCVRPQQDDFPHRKYRDS
jgi:hypothetical protein